MRRRLPQREFAGRPRPNPVHSQTADSSASHSDKVHCSTGRHNDRLKTMSLLLLLLLLCYCEMSAVLHRAISKSTVVLVAMATECEELIAPPAAAAGRSDVNKNKNKACLSQSRDTL